MVGISCHVLGDLLAALGVRKVSAPELVPDFLNHAFRAGYGAVDGALINARGFGCLGGERCGPMPPPIITLAFNRDNLPRLTRLPKLLPLGEMLGLLRRRQFRAHQVLVGFLYPTP
ncbi:hypothetical protein C9E82_00065 [Paracoccus siganidrum]|uniref:Uncharacterized protein n=1 Tax=Paracoccus siganidrum TaxID=1276757 RepID=A0A419A891_9RHOB|nr:hypothetical protein D3P05_08460 [Paracoccus siganidrum]RMC40975.1 hypothetical protein C9E82_00065 [Paracoccus siganidrum]